MADLHCPLCPCDSLLPYDACCGPLLRGELQAGTAEALMRSRYTAYGLGDGDYLWRTWHPRTRPSGLPELGETVWTGLRITSVEAGGENDSSGMVSFVASYVGGELVERSRFERRAGRWFYVDGDLP